MKQRILEFEPGDVVTDLYTAVEVGVVCKSGFHYKVRNGTREKVWFADVYWVKEGTTRRTNQHWITHYNPETP
jgi:hypothetical protein